MTTQDLSKLINSYRVHQIRSGSTHRFVDISIVEAGGCFFVRQYKFGKRSWYDAFLSEPNGAIKCGEVIVPIKGVVPADLDDINPLVTKAFWKKYHLIYGFMRLGFNTKRHEASTLELIPEINNK